MLAAIVVLHADVHGMYIRGAEGPVMVIRWDLCPSIDGHTAGLL